jgi:hypothetical protein
LGITKAFETAFQTFNNYLSNITRKRNASIVGPSKQITGEYPSVDFTKLYNYYHHWDQIKKAVDTMHQKFMGSGIRVEIDDDSMKDFAEKWMEVCNFQKKISDFFLNVIVTGNGILELQYTEDNKLGNIEVIPMQTIWRVFRDEFGNEIKIVQNIDGVFKELDPKNYLHWTINNPDRQAFGKSEFFTVASPRSVSPKVDPITGETVNDERSLMSLLDAQAELQNAEVEIKKLMAKPRIFASFPNMPQEQLNKLQKELQDSNTSQTIWAFDREAKMVEASVSGKDMFNNYGQNVDDHIDIGTGFASKIIKTPQSFSYSSSQTPLDVLDQRMNDLQADAREMIKDSILRPLFQSWGFEDFDDFETIISFMPSVKRLMMEDIRNLPLDAVSPEEKRELLKNLHIPLNDDLWEEFNAKQEISGDVQGLGNNTPKTIPNLESPKSPISPIAGSTKIQQDSASVEQPDSEDDRPKPPRTDTQESLHPMFSNPVKFEDYIKKTISESIKESLESISTPKKSSWRGDEKPDSEKERYKISPKINTSDLYVSGGITDEDGTPSISDPEIEKQLHNQFDNNIIPSEDDNSNKTTAYRGKNAPNPNDNFDITGPIDPKRDKIAPSNPIGQVPKSVISRIEKELLGDDPKKIERLKSLLETDIGEEGD